MNPDWERKAAKTAKDSRGFAAFAVFAFLVVCAVAAPGAQRRDYPTRPPADSAAVERGKALYGVNCQFCHGADTRGGDSGPSLLRSGVAADDQHGELMARSCAPDGPACRSSR